MSRPLGRVCRRPTLFRNFRLSILALPFVVSELGGCAYVIVPEDASEGTGGAGPSSGGAASDSGGAVSNGGSATLPSGGSGEGTGGRIGAPMGGRFGGGMGGRFGGGTGGGVPIDPTCTCERTWVVSTNITPPLTPGDCIGYMGTLYEYDPEMPNQLQWADPACTPPTSGSQNCMYHARLVSRGPCP